MQILEILLDFQDLQDVNWIFKLAIFIGLLELRF